jgi:DNA-binding response OmpR family regulator
MNRQPIVLLVGSERALELRSALKRCGFTVITSASPEGALLQYGRHAVEAVVAVLPLGGMGTAGLCDEIAGRGGTPVLVASGRRLDRFNALRAGADDHVKTPCTDLELRARIRSMVRRARSGQTTQRVVIVGHLGIVVGRDVITLAPAVPLTPLQAALLIKLVVHRDAVVSDETLRQVAERANQADPDQLESELVDLRFKVGTASGMSNAVERIDRLGWRLVTGTR